MPGFPKAVSVAITVAALAPLGHVGHAAPAHPLASGDTLIVSTQGGASKIWKPIEQLRARYVAQGITPDTHVILYCNTGTEASHVFFALRNLLGYPNVDVYFPSWTEWSGREELPIETGDPT